MNTEERMKQLLSADTKTLARIDRVLRGEEESPESKDDIMLLTWSQAARETGISRTTLWRWAKAGGIQTVELPGGRTRVPRAALRELIRKELHALRTQAGHEDCTN